MDCHGKTNGTRERRRAMALPGLAFFFEFFLFRRHEPRRRTQRFAVVEERQIPHVERQRAGRRLLVDDDGDRTAFDTLAERNPAAASQPRVRESLQHRPDYTLQERLDFLLESIL